MIREQNIQAANEIIELFCELIVSRLTIITKQKYVHIYQFSIVYLLDFNFGFLYVFGFLLGNVLWILRKVLLV